MADRRPGPAGPSESGTGPAVLFRRQRDAAAVGPFSRYQLPVAAAMGGRRELEPLPRRAIDGACHPHGGAVPAQAESQRHHGWRHRLAGYSGEGGFQESASFFTGAALTIPDSPPVRFDQASIILDHGHVQLAPALVHTADQDQAEIQADYAMNEQTLDLSISTESMKVASLRSQVALAAVPWLEQVRSGQWSGQLHYHREPTAAGVPGSGGVGSPASAAGGSGSAGAAGSQGIVAAGGADRRGRCNRCASIRRRGPAGNHRCGSAGKRHGCAGIHRRGLEWTAGNPRCGDPSSRAGRPGAAGFRPRAD